MIPASAPQLFGAQGLHIGCIESLIVVFRRLRVYRLDEGAGGARRHILMDAVAQVEHMIVAVAKTGQNGSTSSRDARRRSYRASTDPYCPAAPLCRLTRRRVGDIGGPVQPQRIAAGGSHRLQPLPAAFGKQRHRHAAAVIFTQQAIDDLACATRTRGNRARSVAAPGVEHHHRDCAPALDLGVEVQDHAVRQLVQQQVQRGRFGIHHFSAW